MEIVKTSLRDLLIIKPQVFEDERGYFMESFKDSFVKQHLPHIKFIQDNESRSNYGVLRGLHFQNSPHEQTKLVRVVEGKVLDVAVDLRKESKTYGKWESFILSSSNKKQLLIPRGFAHGFLTLSKTAIFQYKVDNEYNKDSETTISFDDKILNIDWKLKESELIISEKDREGISFSQLSDLNILGING